MTYKAAYKELNKRGTIDQILSSEQAHGANFNQTKVDIIDCIEYYCSFRSSDTFKGMKYWQDMGDLNTEAKRSHRRIYNTITKTLAAVELENAKREIEQLEYLRNSINEI